MNTMKKRAALFFALAMILSLAACGGGTVEQNDPNQGKYIGQQVYVFDWEPIDEIYEGESYIELNAGGKGTICLDDSSTGMTWKLDGENITLTAEDQDCTGTLKDGLLTIDNFFGMEMTFTFLKEGVETPDTNNGT